MPRKSKVSVQNTYAKLFGTNKIEINEFTFRILETIKENWPTNPLEVANELGETGTVKSLSSKYLYHFKKLHKIGLIDMKKMGNTYIAWPVDIEKLRVLHEMVREGD